MDKLTKRDQYGEVICYSMCNKLDTDGDVCYENCKVAEQLELLAAYEDSGLTPERVQELAAAERDGRLVVLPCKLGTEVYWIAGVCGKDQVVATIIEAIRLWRDGFALESGGKTKMRFFAHEIGKTVFLTRAEAEAALAKEGEAK